MERKRQEAYRHLLYAALLHLRTGPPPLIWWSVNSWRRTRSELLKNKALADCFHNLAAFSVRDFASFDETRFWNDVDHLGRRHGNELTERYRRIFDAYMAGTAAYVC
jgi:hypothetical protein